jgi:hypothetical protein
MMPQFGNYLIAAIPVDVKLSICVRALDIGASSAIRFTGSVAMGWVNCVLEKSICHGPSFLFHVADAGIRDILARRYQQRSY